MKGTIHLTDGDIINCDGNNVHFQYNDKLLGIQVYYKNQKEVFYPFSSIKSVEYIYSQTEDQQSEFRDFIDDE